MKFSTRQWGFTIIELLVVIVVIGILAGITTVAYGGIQNSARAAKMLAAVDAYTKAATIYKSFNGTFPNPTPGTVVYTCLGTSYPASGAFGAGSCINGNGTDATFLNNTLNSQFSSVIDNLPDTSDISIKSGTTSLRGIQYSVSANDTNHSILYYTPGQNQKCGRGIAQNAPAFNATECRVNLL